MDSFRLDKGASPPLSQVNLVCYLNLGGGSDEISGKLSGGKHSSSAAKNGRCYDCGINQAGDRSRIRKEDPHPNYSSACKTTSPSLGSLNGKWVGYQWLKWNSGSSVTIQIWVDITGVDGSNKPNSWQKILEWTDTGGCYESPYLQPYQTSDSQTTVRVDGMSSSKFKYMYYAATYING